MSEHATEAPPQGASTETLPMTEEAFLSTLPDEGDGNTPSEVPAAAEAASEGEGTTEADPLAIPDSFTPQDVRGMLESIADPEARAVAEAAYKNLQADYTKSKQQLSEQASQFEGLEDLDKARAAVEFYDGIQNDPEFALEVHGYLTNVFKDMGMTPKEADQAASEQMTPPAEAAAQAPSFDEDPDAALKAELDQVKSRLDTWEAQEKQRRQQAEIDELAADLLKQEMALREAHTNLKDEDIDEIYDLATARGSTLAEAYNRLSARDQRVIESYMETKQKNVPPPEPAPATTAVAPEIPRLPDGTPDLDAVHAIAVQKLQNALAGRE